MSDWRKEFAKVVDPEHKGPRRRVEIVLRLSADSWDDAVNELGRIQLRLDESARKEQGTVNVVSGGYSTGYILLGDEDRNVTHDSWREALRVYLDEKRGASGE